MTGSVLWLVGNIRRCNTRSRVSEVYTPVKTSAPEVLLREVFIRGSLFRSYTCPFSLHLWTWRCVHVVKITEVHLAPTLPGSEFGWVIIRGYQGCTFIYIHTVLTNHTDWHFCRIINRLKLLFRQFHSEDGGMKLLRNADNFYHFDMMLWVYSKDSNVVFKGRCTWTLVFIKDSQIRGLFSKHICTHCFV